MPRVKRGSARRNKRKKVLKLTKGFFLGKSEHLASSLRELVESVRH